MKRTRNLTCKGKQHKYAGRPQAKAAMLDFYRRNFGGVVSPGVSVYPCNGHFHWGHSRARKS